MSAFGGLLITNKGRNLQAKAQLGAPLVYTRIGLGDGHLGTTPISELNSLKNQVLSLAIVKLKVINSTTAVIGTVLNNNSISSGFYFREIGVFAKDPDIGEILYCYGNARDLAEYIPPGGGSDVVEKAIDVQVLTGNATNISAVIDSSLIFETPEGAQEKIDIALGKHMSDYLAHTGYAIATGSANTYVANLSPALSKYVEGVSLRVKINVANTGASTINVNGLGSKSIKKSNGNALAAGNLKLGSIYTLAYDGTSFILQGEGGEYGTATVAHVLEGKTIGTEEGLKIGTIPDRSNLQVAGSYVSPKSVIATPHGELTIEPQAGYYKEGLNASGYGPILAVDPEFRAESFLANKNIFGLQGNIPDFSRAALGQTYAQALSMKADGGGSIVVEPQRGYYEPGLNVSGYGSIIFQDTDFIANNIKAGINILGVDGILDPAAMGGANRLASGSVTSSNDHLQFRQLDDWSQLTNAYHVSVSLDFEPDLIYVYWSTNVNAGVTSSSVYQNNHPRYARAVSLQNSSHYTTGGTGVSRVFRGDADNAYVNANGFRIPVGARQTVYQWYAIKF